MDFVSPIVDILARICDCTVNHSAYIRHLDENMKLLMEAKSRLDSVVEDVKRMVHGEEKKFREILRQVKTWLLQADTLIKEVDDILQKGNEEIQNKCLGSCCPRNCLASYKLGKEVIKKIEIVLELISTGCFSDVARDRPPLPPVIEIPLEKTVDMDSKETEVWKLIEDGSIGIIGLCGMGGVGKTTLLKKLNNKFLNTPHDFDLVIWVEISREMNLKNVQNVIRKRLKIPDDEWQTLEENDRAGEISTKLSSKKFALLLDDVWERIDLNRVGVPLPNDQNRSKIILTTRSEETCSYPMVAYKTYKVECLSEAAA